LILGIVIAFALAKENEHFVARMRRLDRFINQSKVDREALRRMKGEKAAHLSPTPLTIEEAERIYAPNKEEEARELAMARAAMRGIRN
jgi:Arc/MetJ-type ribon-helix-helix transcriptional regulator